MARSVLLEVVGRAVGGFVVVCDCPNLHPKIGELSGVNRVEGTRSARDS